VGDEQDLVRFLQQIGRNEWVVHCLLRVASEHIPTPPVFNQKACESV
jgi:hypothetical protein